MTTHRVVRSAYWLLLNAALTKGLSLTTQVFLASLLLQSDFGTYAIALAISSVALALRDGGSKHWLIQGGELNYLARSGPAFWLGAICISVSASLLALSATPLSLLFGDSDLALLLLIIAASAPLSTFGMYYKARLSMLLRMRHVAEIEFGSMVVRSVSAIVLASHGFGAASFVLPLPLTYVAEAIIGYLRVRERPWRRRCSSVEVANVLRTTKWVVFGTLAAAMSVHGDYLAMGMFVEASVVGVYFLSFQLTFQAGTIVTHSLQRVLTPSLVRLPAARRPAAILRAVRVGVFVGGPLLMLIGTAIGPLESMLWGGKWESAVPVVKVMCLVLPVHLGVVLVQSILLSDGRWQAWAGVNSVRGVIVFLSAGIAGIMVGDDATAISVIVMSGYLVAGAVQVRQVCVSAGVSLLKLARSAMPGVLLAWIAFASAMALDVSLDDSASSLIVQPLAFMVTYGLLSFVFLRKVAKEALAAVMDVKQAS